MRIRAHEYSELRRIFGRNRKEGTGGVRKLKTEEHRNVYISQNNGRVIRTTMIKWAGKVALMREIL